jgi:hypothetical protein
VHSDRRVNEAKAVAKGNTQFETNVGRIASLLFDLTTEGAGAATKIKFATPLPARLSNEFTTMLASTPGGVPRKILDYLFDFVEATTTPAKDYFSRGLGLKSNMTDSASARSSKGEFVFAYRGDTRDLGAIIRQGAKCRAELDFWRNDAGVILAWHGKIGHNCGLKKRSGTGGAGEGRRSP